MRKGEIAVMNREDDISMIRNAGDNEDTQRLVLDEDVEKTADPREEKTERYEDYMRRRKMPEDGATVRLSDYERGIDDPVSTVLSEPQPDSLWKTDMQQHPVTDGGNIRENSQRKVDEIQTGSRGRASFKIQEAVTHRQRSQQNGVCYQPVGWLICIEGPDFGKSFPLYDGKNTIGRLETMDVVLKNDIAVSRNEHAWIEYREEDRSFIIGLGENRKMVYINDDLVMRPKQVMKNDEIYLGDSILMLIPCCDDMFSWDSAAKHRP